MSLTTLEPGQIPQQSGRFRTRRQDAPPSWTTPEGPPPNPREIFFVPPPSVLGAVLLGESELEIGKSTTSGTAAKIIGAIILGPLFGFVTLLLATWILRAMGDRRPDDTTPLIALGGLVIGLIVGWRAFGRNAGTKCFYVCEGGIVRYFINGHAVEGEVLHFREAADMRHDVSRMYRKGVTLVSHDYTWRSRDGRNLYRIGYLEHLPGLGRSLTSSAVLAWARWQKHQQG